MFDFAVVDGRVAVILSKDDRAFLAVADGDRIQSAVVQVPSNDRPTTTANANTAAALLPMQPV